MYKILKITAACIVFLFMTTGTQAQDIRFCFSVDVDPDNEGATITVSLKNEAEDLRQGCFQTSPKRPMPRGL